MGAPRQRVAILKNWSLGEKTLALAFFTLGACFIAVGAHMFRVRPEPFGLPSILGCVAGAFAAFFLVLVTDYVFHHARLVFIPWFIFLIYFAFVQPHFGVGLGLALWFMLASQLRG